MNLPQELLEEILSYLPPEDGQGRQSLANCSLVSKSWTNPSRRHLFKTVNISKRSLQSWRETISPTNYEFLQHIQALSYTTDTKDSRSGYQPPEYCIDVLQDYFPSLHQLQHLSLLSMQIPSDISLRLEIFSAFQYTLSRLSLMDCDMSIGVLVTLINHFPNLDHLDLSSLRRSTDGKPTPSLSRSRMRRLHLSHLRADILGIVDQLSELGLAFDQVVVNDWQPVRPNVLTRIAETVGGKARCIELLRTDRSCTCTRP